MYLYKYVGRKLYGYCNGYFGRESYETKRIVYAGANYIVVEHEDDDIPAIAYFSNATQGKVEELLKDWMDPSNQDNY